MSKLLKSAAPDPKKIQILAALSKSEYERLLPDPELVATSLGGDVEIG